MDGISIVMAYHNRRELLIKTLNSINETKYDKKTLEIIIINDCSSEEHNINDLPIVYNSLNIKLFNVDKKDKDWVNACVTYNIGFSYIKYDKVIIQNPECYHNGDILSHTDKNLTDKNFLSYGCYSLSWDDTKNDKYEYIELLNQKSEMACSPGWYNHTEYRPLYYHFCSSITKDNLEELNGFDEDYKDGIGYDDNEFVHRIRLLHLDMKIINDPFVFHQAHDSENYRHNSLTPKLEKDQKKKLFYENGELFKNKTSKLLDHKIHNNKYYDIQ